ncbi:MAG: segregation/condensation protein A [Peptoniphilaceae bacterium]|nr:segregation/condensation protein A [Peptoniphilaceae bacterium]MDY6086026.1 segregation/condensation protein A [Peptoniphilaceae bacterium]
MITVETRPFQGPMDLLLTLVRQAKVDIYEIEISDMTESYLLALQTEPIPPDELSDFIDMASLLVRMKIRLLIRDQEEEEEEGLTEEEFIARLAAYRLYKSLAETLTPRQEMAQRRLTKMGEDPEFYRPLPEEKLEGKGEDLFTALLAMRKRQEEKRPRAFEVEDVLSREEISERQIAARIRERMARGERFSFWDLLDVQSDSKGAVIVTFLVLLELVRRDAVALEQDDAGGIAIHLADREHWTEALDQMDPKTTPQEDA